MDTKTYLSQVYKLQRLIDVKNADLESYRELSSSILGSYFEEIHNATRNTDAQFVKYLHKIDEIEREIAKDIEKLNQLKFEIGTEIDKLEDLNERLVLRYRHLLCMEWKDIAVKLHYSKRWVQRLHDRAVDHLDYKRESDKN